MPYTGHLAKPTLRPNPPSKQSAPSSLPPKPPRPTFDDWAMI